MADTLLSPFSLATAAPSNLATGAGTTAYDAYMATPYAVADLGAAPEQNNARSASSLFRYGSVNYADTPSSLVSPAFVHTPDLMTLDPDVFGTKTVGWGRSIGQNYGSDYVAGLNVFGRAMSREQLMASDAGRELLEIATRNRQGKKRGFLDALLDFQWSDLPFMGLIASVGGSVADAVTVNDTMKKLQNGEAVTDDELVKTRLYMAKQEYEQTGGIGAMVGDIVRAAPGFVVDFLTTGGVLGWARSAVAGATKATSLAASRAVKGLAKELSEDVLQNAAKEALGEAFTVKGLAGFVNGQASQMMTKLTGRVARSLQGELTQSLASIYGKDFASQFSSKTVRHMAVNLAGDAMKRAAAKYGASNSFKRFAVGLGQTLQESAVSGLMDFGKFYTSEQSFLFGKHNSARRALADALGTLLVEAPVRGSLQYGMNYLFSRPVAWTFGKDGRTVSASELSIRSDALRMSERDPEHARRLADSTESIAMGMNVLEYISENAGRGFGSLFRSIGLAAGIAPQAQRVLTGTVGSVLRHNTDDIEAGGFLRRLVRKSVGTWEDAAKKSAETRTAAVMGVLRRNEAQVGRISLSQAAQIAAGDLTAATPAVRQLVGDDVNAFVLKAVKEEASQRMANKQHQAFFRYFMADWMARHRIGADQVMNAFERMGYDGIVEEMLEERYSDFAKGLFGLDARQHAGFGDQLKQAFQNLYPGWDQLVAEAIGFSIPMGARAIGLSVQRACVGGDLEKTRRVARGLQFGLKAMNVTEMRLGDFVSGVDENISDLEGRKAAVAERAREIRETAVGNGVSDSKELDRLTSAETEETARIDRQIKMQASARQRVLDANGVSDLARMNAEELTAARERMLYVPVTNVSVEEGDLKKDKLREFESSEQLAQDVGELEAAINNAWMIGKAQFDAIGAQDSKLSLPRRFVGKMAGIAASIITGDPALAFRNYAQWAAADEGLNPLDAAVLLGTYKTARRETLDAIRKERAGQEGGHDVSEDEVWERMADRYKAAAADVMRNRFALAHTRMFSQTEMLDQAVLHLARREGYAFDETSRTFRKSGAGEVSFEGFYSAHRDEAEQLRQEIAHQTFKLLSSNVGSDDAAARAFAVLPANQPDAAHALERTAMSLALRMSGFRDLLRIRTVDEKDTVEDALNAASDAVDSGVFRNIAARATRADGSVDYSSPSDADIVGAAQMLGWSVFHGDDQELANLRKAVVDLSRQVYEAYGLDDVIVYKYDAHEDTDERLYPDAVVTMFAHKNADGTWYLESTANDKTGGRIRTQPFADEAALDEYMASRKFVRTERQVVVTPAEVLEFDDPVLAAQQFGLMPQYLHDTVGDTSGAVDYTKTHPLLRKDADGNNLYKSPRDVAAAVRNEMFWAGMYQRYREDASRYPGETAKARLENVEKAQDMYERVYGSSGYMTVLDRLLAARGFTVPKDNGLSGFLTGRRGKYQARVSSYNAYRQSANIYVSVGASYGMDNSAAVAAALVDHAIEAHWNLVNSRGRMNHVVTDALRRLDQIAEQHIYNPDTTPAERAAFRNLRNDITQNWRNPTKRAFTTIVMAYPLWFAERDRMKNLSSSGHSLALQKLASDFYMTPEFLLLTGLTDVILGGDGFAFAAAAAKYKASREGVPLRGIERMLAVFHGDDVNALREVVGKVHPLGRSYDEFVREVNRVSHDMGLDPVPEAQKNAERSKRLPSWVFDVFRDANFTDFDKVTAALARLGQHGGREFARTMDERRVELSNYATAIQTEMDRRKKEIEDLGRELKEARESMAGKAADDAGLQAKYDTLSASYNEKMAEFDSLTKERDELEGKVAVLERQVQAAVAAGFTPERLPDQVRVPETDRNKGEADVPANGELSGNDAVPDNDVPDNESFLRLSLDTARLDATASVHADVDSEGKIVIVDNSSTLADLNDEALDYGASLMNNFLNALAPGGPSADRAPRELFVAQCKRLFPGMREEELAELYTHYSKQTDIRRLRHDVDVPDGDYEEGTHSENSRGFGDKALADYEGHELKVLLDLLYVASPETGRNLQWFMDMLRTDVEREAAQSGASDAVRYLQRFLNPRAAAVQKTNDNKAPFDALEKLRAEQRENPTPERAKEIDELRLQVAESMSSTDREALWRLELNSLDTVQSDGRTLYDHYVGQLMQGRAPLRQAAVLLSFLRSLDRPARVRLMGLLANSAHCSRARAYREGDRMKFQPVTGHPQSVDSRIMDAAFLPLARMAPSDAGKAVSDLKAKLRQLVESGRLYGSKDSVKGGDLAKFAHNAAALADTIAEVFGADNPMVRILRSQSVRRYLDEGYQYSEYRDYARKLTQELAVALSPDIGGPIPDMAESVIGLLERYLLQLNVDKSLSEGSDEAVMKRTALMRRLVVAWQSFGVGLHEGAAVPHKTAMVSPIWKRLLRIYASSQPVTVERSDFIPGRSQKATSKVAVSSRGVIPIIAQWMDRSVRDEGSFAYIAKNFMPGPTGKRLREMSDADFVEKVLPECRQTMRWPDKARTPILAKNLGRDFTSDAVNEACENLYNSLFLRKDKKTGEVKERAGMIRWYVDIYHGEHTSGALLQLPRLQANAVEGAPRFIPQGADYQTAATMMNRALGLHKLGRDAKRASLSSMEQVGMSMHGFRREVDGSLTRGESRIHVLLNYAQELAETKQEALLGSAVGVGYGVEQQRLAATDPESSKLKLHYMSTSGADYLMLKALTSTCNETSGATTGLYAEGSVMRTIQDYLLKFRKADADISTSLMMDKDGLKVCVLNSKMMGVPYDETRSDGTVERKLRSFVDYAFERLRNVKIPAEGLSGKELLAALGDQAAAPEGADPALYGSGTVLWGTEQDGRIVERRVSLEEVLGKDMVAGLQVRPVEGLSGSAIDLSFVDNGMASYTVANVSHVSEPETGRSARNLVLDAVTLASVMRRWPDSMGNGGRTLPEAKQLLDIVANWGLLTTALSTDAATVEDARTGAGMSDGMKALIAAGEDPHALNAESQLAYDVLKRLTKSLNIPLYKLDAALSSAGAVVVKNGIACHSKDPFLRFLSEGSKPYDPEEARWRRCPRPLGFAQVNVRSDGFRYMWHLDRKAFAAQYGQEFLEADGRTVTEKIETLVTDMVRLDRRHADALAEFMKTEGDVARRAKWNEVTVARASARDAREKFTACFVDHYGQRVSEAKCHWEQAARAKRSPKFNSDKYCHSVSFFDLFDATGAFDRSAVMFGSKEAFSLPKQAGGAEAAADGDPVVLAGSFVGLPRTPSLNGSMWAQGLRASIPAETATLADGTVVPGRDATIIPDAQSLKIEGVDHDGDKTSMYLEAVDTNTGTVQYTNIPGPLVEGTAEEGGMVPMPMSAFEGSPSARRAYLRQLTEAGLVSAPQKGLDAAGESQEVFHLSDTAKRGISNVFVRSLRGMIRNLPVDGHEGGMFYGSPMAKETKAAPVEKVEWDALKALSDKALEFLRGTDLADSKASSHVMTSASSADRARASVVSLMGVLHFAQLSGRFEDLFSRSGETRNLQDWIGFIYGADGISNATFDDIKEQICRRLGWTQNMIETVLVDLMFSGAKAPTDSAGFYTVLADYVRSVAEHTSRHWMIASSEPPEGNPEYTRVHKEARSAILGWDPKRKKISDTSIVSRDSVMTAFGIVATAGGPGGVEYRFAEDRPAKSPGAAAFRLALARAVSETEGVRLGDVLETMVRFTAEHGGENPGIGYLAWIMSTVKEKTLKPDWLATEEGGRLVQEAKRYVQWLEGRRLLALARQYATAVNFMKADPADAGKQSRRDVVERDYEEVLKRDRPAIGVVDPEVDAAMDKFKASTTVAYSAAGLLPTIARGALAANVRTDALAALAQRLARHGFVSGGSARLVATLAAMEGLPSYEQLRLEANYQTLLPTLSALRTCPAALSGLDVFGGERAWENMDAIARAMLGKVDPDDASAAQRARTARTMALRRGLEAMFSVMYALSSTSSESAQNSPFAYFDLTADYAYVDEVPNAPGLRAQWPGAVRLKNFISGGEVTDQALVPLLRRVLPSFRNKDRMGMELARDVVRSAMEGGMDSRVAGVAGHKRTPLFGAEGSAQNFALSKANLDAFETEIKGAGEVKDELKKDIASVRKILAELAAVAGVSEDAAVIEPSTMFNQILPFLTAFTSRVTGNESVLELLPGVYERLSRDMALLLSGAVDGGRVPPGYSVFDIACSTAIGPLHIPQAGVSYAAVDETALTQDVAGGVVAQLREATGPTGHVAEPGRLRETGALGGVLKAMGMGGDNAPERLAPESRAMVDVLGPDGLVRQLYDFAQSAAASVPLPEEIRVPEARTEVPVTGAPGETPASSSSEVKRLQAQLSAVFGEWADVRVLDDRTITVRSRHGLTGAVADRFARQYGASRTDLVVTVHVGQAPVRHGVAPRPVNVDVNSMSTAMSFCELAKELHLDPAEFLQSLSHEERTLLVKSLTRGGGSLQATSFSLALPSWGLSGRDLMTLAGEIQLSSADAGDAYHEMFHALFGMFLTMGAFSSEDIAALREKFGPAPKSGDKATSMLFNEEKAAEAFREYVERVMKKASAVPTGEPPGKTEGVFKKIHDLVVKLLDLLARGFSYRDPKRGAEALFDMMLAGHVSFSNDYQEGHIFARRLVQRIEANRVADSEAPAEGEPTAAEDEASRRMVESKAAGARNDTFIHPTRPRTPAELAVLPPAEAADAERVDRVPNDTPYVQELHNLLAAELRRPKPRVAALRYLIDAVVSARRGRTAPAAMEVDTVGAEPSRVTPSEELRFRLGKASEASKILSDESRAYVYGPEASVGRAVVRLVHGMMTDEDLAIFEENASAIPPVQRYEMWLQAHGKMKSKAYLDKVRANEAANRNAALTGIAQFERMTGRSLSESQRNAAYMNLNAAIGRFSSGAHRAANAQRGVINAVGGLVAYKRFTTASDYCGFLVASGWHDVDHYLHGLRDRLAGFIESVEGEQQERPENRNSKTAKRILDVIRPLMAFDTTRILSDAGAWGDKISFVMRDLMAGYRRGGLDPATGKYLPYERTEPGTDPDPDAAAQNQAVYQFGQPDEDGTDDRIAQSLLHDAISTVLGLAASTKFFREIGWQPGSILNGGFTGRTVKPVEFADLAVEFAVGSKELLDGTDIISKNNEPGFIMGDLESWMAASLPRVAGNDTVRDMMMKASAELRGRMSVLVDRHNFLAAYMGVNRSFGRKLLRLVNREGKFEMSNGFYRTVEEGARKTYLGFDAYHGVEGDTVDESFTEDEFRTVSMFLTATAAYASGGTKMLTAFDKIKFTQKDFEAFLDWAWYADEKDPKNQMLRIESVTPEGIRQRYLRTTTRAEGRAKEVNIMPKPLMALYRLTEQWPQEAWGTVGEGDQRNGMDYFKKVRDAFAEAAAAVQAAHYRSLADGHEWSAEYINDAMIAELERRGVAIGVRTADGKHYDSAVLTFDVREVEAMFRGSSAFRKLEAAGRRKKFMTMENLAKEYMEPYNALRREVRNHPWLTEGDARFLNNFDTPLPFYQGNGTFMFHANRVSREMRRQTASIQLERYEEEFRNLCSSGANQTKFVESLSPGQLAMLHDYFGTEETGDRLLAALISGEYAPGTSKAAKTGLEVSRAATWLDVAKIIYHRLTEQRLARLEDAESAEGPQSDEALARMIREYEDMAASPGTTLTGGVGLTDEQAYRMHGVLPANMQIGHKVMTAAKGIVDSMYKRSVLVNMLFTKNLDGTPMYYMNPTLYAVRASGIPDGVWEAAAKWWLSFHPDVQPLYDAGKTGLENARAVYAGVSAKLSKNGGKLGSRPYEAMAQTDMEGSLTVDAVLCAKDDPADTSTSSLNAVGGTGEALGYAKHFFLTDRVPGGARLQWLDHVMAWSKSLSVIYSAFFPIATKWESHVGAVGALATLGSNLSPEFVRRHKDGLNKIQKLFRLGVHDGWLGEDFIGFRDIIEMMDTNDPFLADVVRWAEALGITMSTTLNNPMEPNKGYVAGDLDGMCRKLQGMGWSPAFVSKFKGVLEAVFLRSGEKAFTYALNATKLAVTCQMAMKLRHEAKEQGRAFDPIRDLAKYAAYIDTEIGGINPLRYAWAHPGMQKLMNRVWFSWQWTRSSWEAGGGHLFEDVLFGGHTINKKTRSYIVGRWVRMFGTVMIGVPMMMQALVKAVAKAAGVDDDDDKWFTWENEEKARWSAYNITPLMKAVHNHESVARLVSGLTGAAYGWLKGGGFGPGALVGAAVGAVAVPNYTGEDAANTTKGRKYYMHFGKQGWEFLRWFDDPVGQVFSKLSMPTQRALEGLFGRNLAYLDRELPFSERSFAERWLSLTADSATVNMISAFLPFTFNTLSTFSDAGYLGYFGPIQMGASITGISDRLTKALSAWAVNDRTGYVFGAKKKKREARGQMRSLVRDILQDARSNGIADPDELMIRAAGRLLPKFYAQLERLLPQDPSDAVDAKAITRVCRAINRLGGSMKGAMQSLDKRLRMRGIKFKSLPAEQRLLMAAAMREGFSRPFDY